MSEADQPQPPPMELPTPEELEKVVQGLTSLSLSKFKEAELCFLRWQRDKIGWPLADKLLQSDDPSTRFYGAQTFKTKITRDWTQVKQNDVASLREVLLRSLVRVSNLDDRRTVMMLSSDLTAYYFRSSEPWNQCVRHVMAGLLNSQNVSIETFHQLQCNADTLVTSLSGSSLLTVLWFATGLAQEARHAVVINSETRKFHWKLCSNLADVVTLMHHCSNNSKGPMSNKLAKEALVCFQSWTMYAQRAWVDKAIELQSLRTMTPVALKAMESGLIYDPAADALAEILTEFPSFLTTNDCDQLVTILSGFDSQKLTVEMTSEGASSRASRLAQVLMAFGDAFVQDLARSDGHLQSRILQRLMALLKHPGIPGVDDDDICGRALDFWMNYVDFISDSLFTLETNQRPPWMLSAQQRIFEVIEVCWAKLCLPSAEEQSNWDSDMDAGFAFFRNSFQEILQTSYTLLGIDIFREFGRLVLESLEKQEWPRLEAALFCLNTLSEPMSDEAAGEEILVTLFASPLFATLADVGNTWEVPTKTRQTAVTLTTKYINFFVRHPEHLALMLNFLFESLKSHSLASVASKAILVACSSYREVLAPHLQAFVDQYRSILSWDSVEPETKERVIGGIAAIVQALPSEESKEAPLVLLTDFISQDASACIPLLIKPEPPEKDELEARAVCALRCLASMGKSLQTPDDVPVDLDSETPRSGFWSSAPGTALQNRVFDLVQGVVSVLPNSSDVMDAACDTVRAGYKETSPGLFVFPASMTVDFFRKTTIKTPRIDKVLATAAVMLSKNSDASDPRMRVAAADILSHTMILLSQLDYDPSSEPEAASSIIELAHRMIPHYLMSMNAVAGVKSLFIFNLACLASEQILPREAAAKFWAALVTDYGLSGKASTLQQTAIYQYGPRLCEILVRGIAGEAPRSALDSLAEPLRKLVFAQPKAKEWLSIPLFGEQFPSPMVGPLEKRAFLHKVLMLRGARKTNSEVKDFWVRCRGMENNIIVS